MRIVDPATGEDVATGERGELWARGYVVMKGYYNMPEQTAAAITAGRLAAQRRPGVDRRATATSASPAASRT